MNLSLRSIRLILFDKKGVKIFEDWLPVRTTINGLHVEQDPKEWWQLLKELLGNLSQKKEIVKNITTLTVTSSAQCLVVINDDGDPIDKVFMVSDKRAADEADEIRQYLLQISELNAHKVDASYLLPKILWLKKHKRSVFRRAKRFLSANDYLLFKLTGKYVTDIFNAEKCYYDRNSRSYPKKLLKKLGLSSSYFPKVVDPGTGIGNVQKGVVGMFPFLSQTKVFVGTYDALCALIGSSTHEEGELNNVCGTCSSYRVFTHKKSVFSPKLLEQEFVSEKLRIIGGSNNLEGGVLEWAKECYYSDVYPKDDALLYSLIEREATESSLGANGLLFIPYLIGERLPISDIYVRGMFFGMERFHSRKDIIRSIFEANAFQAKMMVDEFEKSGIEIAKINMSGGVAKLSLAAQIRADVLGIPVHVVKEVETTALGAYILCQKGRGKLASIKEGSKLIAIEKKYIPNMHNHNCYASLFMLYKELYETNASLFKKRHEILKSVMHYQKKVLENL
ncbi:MAG: FGGY family carbohydrate kinase [bacterium]|nr:FGGY family carbohydrate kinase [bacterium]